jgi:hypothetical protein
MRFSAKSGEETVTESVSKIVNKLPWGWVEEAMKKYGSESP